MDRPILFSAPMIRAILAGTKTRTRRALPADAWLDPELGVIRMCSVAPGVTGFQEVACRYGRPGDRLWVRETHAFSVIDPEGRDWREDPENWDVIYRADDKQPAGGWRDADGKVIPPPWRPAIHMPRWASRITLEVTGVRVERLQDISEADAVAEGLRFSAEARRSAGCMGIYECELPDGKTHFDSNACDLYRKLWEQINGPGTWEANPWVWVIEFKRAAPRAEGGE